VDEGNGAVVSNRGSFICCGQQDHKHSIYIMQVLGVQVLEGLKCPHEVRPDDVPNHLEKMSGEPIRTWCLF
jgi:hypothetical protein